MLDVKTLNTWYNQLTDMRLRVHQQWAELVAQEPGHVGLVRRHSKLFRLVETIKSEVAGLLASREETEARRRVMEASAEEGQP